jgi:hypothetical protein
VTEPGAENAMVTTVRRSGQMVLMNVEPGDAPRIPVIVDYTRFCFEVL